MAYVASHEGEEHRLEVIEAADGFRVRLGEREVRVDTFQASPSLYSLIVDGRSYEVYVLAEEDGLSVLVEGHAFRVGIQDERDRKLRLAAEKPAPRGGALAAPMPGKVVKLLVGVGDEVRAGQGVIVVEAMKMENELKAPATGVVREIKVAEGKAVNGGEVLLVIE